MAGEAKTNRFMLGTATVMLGPQALLRDLEPALHSIGLVKAVTFSAEPTYTELTQGVTNSLVFSALTANAVKASMEVYEYTAANLKWALGQDASAIVAFSVTGAADAEITAAQADITLGAGEGASFTVDDWIMVQNGGNDHVMIRQITGIATDVLTCDLVFPTNLPVGTVINKVNRVDIGEKVAQPFLGCKIVGTLADGSEMTMLLPKVRITNGFNIGFASDNYANMPFELTVFDLVAADPHFVMFDGAQGSIFVQ